ncbi:disease resistance protein RGA2-like [Prunus yedoensis var. nudiflora]|uniref:Disease resistance protein RGA2-like n=1 Tax=Prunus yedoensis var. nudiflora TaxID=2094558 RepID=A0A314XPT5_PRUYE|nr:disease resistance protein RGA2-like [Prunus yedoensis var. nudiflora]
MAIVGMAGLGKTAVAKAVYNEAAISKHFDVKLWVFVSVRFSVKLILSQILEILNPTKVVGRLSKKELVENLRNELTGKRYFLVLDDVWNDDSQERENLMSCFSVLISAQGSKIIVSTRSARVASITETLPRCDLRTLAGDECWLILKDRAFPHASADISPDLERIGREIAKNCSGMWQRYESSIIHVTTEVCACFSDSVCYELCMSLSQVAWNGWVSLEILGSNLSLIKKIENLA